MADRLMDCIYRKLFEALTRHHGVDPATAAQTASTVCAWIIDEHGGTRCTLPSPRATRPDRINAALEAGRHPEEIAKEMNVNIRTVYRAKARRSIGRGDWDL